MTAITLSPTAEHALAHTFQRALEAAGYALVEMTGREILVITPEVRRCNAQDVADLAGGADEIVVAIYLGIEGAISGHALLLLPPEGARSLARTLLDGFADLPPPDPETPWALDELELSALQEVGNVTIGTFLNEIGRHFSTPVVPTPPQAIVEQAGAVLDAVLADLLAETDEILAAKTAFVEGVHAIEGALLVLPRAESLPILLDALGIVD